MPECLTETWRKWKVPKSPSFKSPSCHRDIFGGAREKFRSAQSLLRRGRCDADEVTYPSHSS
jgi:hypothetical protein